MNKSAMTYRERQAELRVMEKAESVMDKRIRAVQKGAKEFAAKIPGLPDVGAKELLGMQSKLLMNAVAIIEELLSTLEQQEEVVKATKEFFSISSRPWTIRGAEIYDALKQALSTLSQTEETPNG